MSVTVSLQNFAICSSVYILVGRPFFEAEVLDVLMSDAIKTNQTPSSLQLLTPTIFSIDVFNYA